MQVLKMIGYTLLSIFIFLAFGVVGYWIYYKINVDEITTTTGYINAQEYKDETFYFIHLRNFTNKNENGIATTEFNFSGYTNENLQGLYSVGFQTEGELQMAIKGGVVKPGLNHDHYEITSKHFVYDTSEQKSFGSMRDIGSNDFFVLNLGTSETPYPALLKIKSDCWKAYKTGTFRTFSMRYDIYKLIYDLQQAIKPMQYGTTVVNMDLSAYFDIYPLVEDEAGNKAWSNVCTTDKSFVYVQVRVDKYQDGMITHSQSIFNAYLGENDWSIVDSESYWKNTVSYTLTEKDFEYTIVDENAMTYIATIKKDAVKFINMFYDIDIIVDIDLDSNYLSNNKIVLIGLGKEAFDNLDIKVINITSNTQKEFNVYDMGLNYNLHNITLVQGGANS